jgi:hypothetical protein
MFQTKHADWQIALDFLQKKPFLKYESILTFHEKAAEINQSIKRRA